MKNTQQTPGQKSGPGKKTQNNPDERGVEDNKQPAPTNDQYSDDELSDDFISDDEEE